MFLDRGQAGMPILGDNMARRLTKKDLSSLKFQMEIYNSRMKRGEIPKHNNLRHIVCGCGVEGCCFIVSK